MSVTTTRTEPAVSATRRQLAAIQARRYATHPLFLLSLGLSAWFLAVGFNDGPANDAVPTLTLGASFALGLLGLIVANRLVRTEERAIEVLDVSPLSQADRTVAMIQALWVPALAGALYAAVFTTGLLVNPAPEIAIDALGGWPGVIALIVGHCVVSAVGGPLLGIVLARWARFPAAAVVAAVLLFIACMAAMIFSTTIPGSGDNSIVRAVGTAMPYTDWYVLECDEANEVCAAVGSRPGSVVGHLFYTLALCGLAAWAAVIKGAEGEMRARWNRIGAAFGVAAAVTYLWALLG